MTDDFNPDAFLASETTDANDTIEPELPKGEYTGTIEEITPRVINPRSGGPSRLLVTIRWRLSGDEIHHIFGHDNGIIADQKLWIDTTTGDAYGPIDTGRGKNPQLGRLRQALGQNKPGKPWAWSMMLSQSARCTAFSEDGEGDYEGRRSYRVSGVAAL